MYELQAFKSDVLAANLTASATSATLTAGSFGSPSGTQLLVIDYDIPSKREIISCTISSTALTSLTRGEDGTTGVAHVAGAKVFMAFVPSHYSNIFETIYPVGSIYTNASVSTNPGTLLGFGTWTAFGAGKVMVGKNTSGTFATAGATGGEETHTLTTTEMPAHTHNLKHDTYGTFANSVNVPIAKTDSIEGAAQITTLSTGGDGAHNNLQPYIVVYMWQRTA